MDLVETLRRKILEKSLPALPEWFESNPLVALGLYSNILDLGLSEDQLYDYCRAVSRGLRAQLHPDRVGNSPELKELQRISEFIHEHLKSRQNFLKALEDFRVAEKVENSLMRALRESSRNNQELRNQVHRLQTALDIALKENAGLERKIEVLERDFSKKTEMLHRKLISVADNITVSFQRYLNYLGQEARRFHIESDGRLAIEAAVAGACPRLVTIRFRYLLPYAQGSTVSVLAALEDIEDNRTFRIKGGKCWPKKGKKKPRRKSLVAELAMKLEAEPETDPRAEQLQWLEDLNENQIHWLCERWRDGLSELKLYFKQMGVDEVGFFEVSLQSYKIENGCFVSFDDLDLCARRYLVLGSVQPRDVSFERLRVEGRNISAALWTHRLLTFIDPFVKINHLLLASRKRRRWTVNGDRIEGPSVSHFYLNHIVLAII